MKEIKHSIYYRRLIKYSRYLKPLILFFFVFLLLFIIHLSIIYLKYIPAIIAPLQKSLHPDMVLLVKTGFYKIMHKVYITGFMFFSMCLVLINIVWNIRRFLDYFENNISN